MSTLSQLPKTSALLERPTKPSLPALTQALLTDWAADPEAVDLELILAELRLAAPGTSGPDLADRLGHLVWWDQAKLAGSHLGFEGRARSVLGTAFELGVLLISTGAEHPHLQEASLSDIHERWVRHQAADDISRATNLRTSLVLLIIVEGKNSLAPDLYVVAHRMPGDNNESPPPIGVIPVRLHQALEKVKRDGLRRDLALSRELGDLAGLVARSTQDDWREVLKPFDRKRLIDRYRLELRKALESTMGLLEEAAGEQATTPEALSELREAASILVFRVYFVVALERRRLLYTRAMKPGEGLIGLLAAGEQAKDSPFLYLQDLTTAIREDKSVTGRKKRLPV
ncbi:MAG: hypothetical protein KC457_29260, partial [Myxococcales bacterium]|nr:hypothetical protein [Myxococcales bacterium]